jgi:hypothetical protein
VGSKSVLGTWDDRHRQLLELDTMRWTEGEDFLANPSIIAKPRKVAGMIWIVKLFQTLVISA